MRDETPSALAGCLISCHLAPSAAIREHAFGAQVDISGVNYKDRS